MPSFRYACPRWVSTVFSATNKDQADPGGGRRQACRGGAAGRVGSRAAAHPVTDLVGVPGLLDDAGGGAGTATDVGVEVRTAIELYLRPGLGNQRVDKLTVATVQQFLNARRATGDSVPKLRMIRKQPVLPQGRAALRGLRPEGGGAVQGPLLLLLLPRAEERPGRHRPRTLRSRRPARHRDRSRLPAHPTRARVARPVA